MLPVKLYSAVRSSGPRFVQLHAHDHSPVTRVTVCLQDGEELHEDDIVKAAEYDGAYVELSKSDIERYSSAERNIAIKQFTDSASIPSILYDKPYYMVADTGGELAYSILRRAFEKTGKVAIVTFLFYDRERLGVVSVRDGLMMLQTLRYADEIVPRGDIDLPPLPQPAPRQVATAAELAEHYSAPFHVNDYRNEHQDYVIEMIERKAKGLPPKKHQIIAPETTPPEEITDRMQTMIEEKPRRLR